MERATLEDATDGTVLQTVAPVHAPAAGAVRALDVLREHVMAAIAGADFPWGRSTSTIGREYLDPEE
jgi:hypothetical protein